MALPDRLIGGAERTLARIATGGAAFYANNMHLSWTPDGKWIFAPVTAGDRRGIHRISTVSGEMRQITNPGADSDLAPALSPDGRALAFLRAESPPDDSVEAVLRLNLTRDWNPDGTPQVLYKGASVSSGLAWTASGQDLILCNADSAYLAPFNSRLWRAPARSGGALSALGGSDCMTPAVSRPDASKHSMLAFGSSAKAKSTLWKIELPEFDRVTPVVPSTRFDSEADFSPDGHSITFFSNRSGSPEVWVSDLDSTGLHRVTEGANLKSAPRWSPEGSWIAYSTDWQLFVVPVAGGAPVRIPTGGARAAHPSWSRDGQWLYYSSERQVWRIRLDGSTRLPVAGTQGTFLAVEGGAFLAVESPDRKSIFYPRRGEPFTLCKVPIEGGPEEVVQHGLATPAFAVSQKYVYYIRSDRVLYQAPLAGGHARKLGYLPDPVHSPPGRIEFGIAVAPDDSGVIYSVTGPQEVDLQLQRNFQ